MERSINMKNTSKLISEIQEELRQLQDEKYRLFQANLMPTIAVEDIIGVRTPELRKLAAKYAKRDNISEFLDTLPHQFFDENQLHSFIISLEKDFDSCISEVEGFLPYVDNWATSDQLSPKVFKKNAEKLLPHIEGWLQSEHTYTVRFAIGMLMEHFLDERFELKYAELVAGVNSEEYYINMMRAWYFATALAKQYEHVISYIEEKRLDVWTHNKAIQKSIESNRITSEQKEYLRTLKIKVSKKNNLFLENNG